MRKTIVFGLLTLISGCGGTSIHESHILQVQKDTDVSYYRLTIEADSILAKTRYRAGLYDAKALDAVLGPISKQESESEKGSSANKQDKSKEGPQDGGSEKRFVIMYTSNAAEIEELIADFAEDAKTEALVQEALTMLAQKEQVEDEVEAEQTNRKLKRLQEIKAKLKELKAGESISAASLQQLLREIVLVSAY